MSGESTSRGRELAARAPRERRIETYRGEPRVRVDDPERALGPMLAELARDAHEQNIQLLREVPTRRPPRATYSLDGEPKVMVMTYGAKPPPLPGARVISPTVELSGADLLMSSRPTVRPVPALYDRSASRMDSPPRSFLDGRNGYVLLAALTAALTVSLLSQFRPDPVIYAPPAEAAPQARVLATVLAAPQAPALAAAAPVAATPEPIEVVEVPSTPHELAVAPVRMSAPAPVASSARHAPKPNHEPAPAAPPIKPGTTGRILGDEEEN